MIRKIGFVAVQALLIAGISMAILEGLVAFSFRFPTASPIPLSLTRYLHERFDRNVIQVMPECARYDETVTYTLRPGTCTFSSREFSNEYRVNSLGVRDDEASLQHPHTVMLGDSITMGWGVDQEDAFPAIVEKSTGRLTLNAGISSYGTVRELRLFERIDRSALRNIVIQYSSNDLVENASFVNPSAFSTMSQARYQETVDDQRRARRYFPGKYALNVLAQMRAMALGRATFSKGDVPDAGLDRQASLFIHVLEGSPVAMEDFNIVVFALDAGFAEAGRRAAAASGHEWIRRLRFVDTDQIRTIEGAFYVLDDHPTRVGHIAIANLLVPLLAN